MYGMCVGFWVKLSIQEFPLFFSSGATHPRPRLNCTMLMFAVHNSQIESNYVCKTVPIWRALSAPTVWAQLRVNIVFDLI